MYESFLPVETERTVPGCDDFVGWAACAALESELAAFVDGLID